MITIKIFHLIDCPHFCSWSIDKIKIADIWFHQEGSWMHQYVKSCPDRNDLKWSKMTSHEWHLVASERKSFSSLLGNSNWHEPIRFFEDNTGILSALFKIGWKDLRLLLLFGEQLELKVLMFAVPAWLITLFTLRVVP